MNSLKLLFSNSYHILYIIKKVSNIDLFARMVIWKKIEKDVNSWIKNGKREGLFIDYVYDGKVITNYSNGVMHGDYKYWYHSGQLKIHCTLINGQKDGVYELFYPDGQIEALTHSKNGRLVGSYKTWLPNGTSNLDLNFDNFI